MRVKASRRSARFNLRAAFGGAARPGRAGPCGGFTMIEVMVAILLTAIAIIGILALYMAQSRAGAYSRHTSEASVLATDGIEALRSMPSPPALPTLTDVDERGLAGGIFTRTTTVGSLVGTPPNAYYDLRVVVSWDEDGVTRSVVLNGRRNQ
jgi:type II secretory pathway pseudopilin PulG